MRVLIFLCLSTLFASLPAMDEAPPQQGQEKDMLVDTPSSDFSGGFWCAAFSGMEWLASSFFTDAFAYAKEDEEERRRQKAREEKKNQ